MTTSRERQAAKRQRDRAAGIVEVLVRVPSEQKHAIQQVAAAYRGDVAPSVAAGIMAELAGDVDQLAADLSDRARAMLEQVAAVLDGATEDELARLDRQVSIATDRRRRRAEKGRPPASRPV